MSDSAKDYWESNGAIYVHYGMRYGTSIIDGQVGIGCLGKVQKPAETPPDGSNSACAKIVNGNGLTDNIQIQTTPIYATRGRPKKEGEVHRTTLYRRNKKEIEKQGVLL